MPYVLRVTDAKPVAVEALEAEPLIDALRPVLPIKSVQAWADMLYALVELPENGGRLRFPDGTIEVKRQPDGFDVAAFNEGRS